MKIARFDGRNTFENSIKTGINLFVGAGFSVLARNKTNHKLPIGSELVHKLKERFNINVDLSLPQIATILENTKRESFYEYLTQEFFVENYDKRYLSIDKLNPQKIYTTNIDNLIHKIYEKINDKYINDVTYEGESNNDNLAIDYSALHGNVAYKNRKMIFDVASINNAYSGNKRIWNQLALDFEKRPTLFWGYNLNDTGTIQALTADLSIKDLHKEQWIVLRPEDDNASIYFEALGFQIIITDTNNFLDYLESVDATYHQNRNSKLTYEEEYIFGNNMVPRSGVGLPVRPILEFFSGNAPTWFDIISNQIHRTSHFNIINDALHTKRNLIIQGAPVSGKTTVMMQIAYHAKYERKLIFDNLSINKAKLLGNILSKKSTIIFIDNFTDSLEAFNYLSKIKNIQVVGVDRSHNFSIVSHLIDIQSLSIINVTPLKESDYQKIYDKLPLGTRSEKLISNSSDKYDNDTIYEFVKRNVKQNSISDRFKNVIKQLEDQDYRLTEFLVLTAYVHNARIPISFDMLYSYFMDDIESLDEIYELRDHLTDMIRDYHETFELDDQDYFYPRSYYLAETILKIVPGRILQEVMTKMLNNVSNTKIIHYNTYKKYAYDKNLVVKAFSNWEDGKSFYETAYQMDFKNPFVLQQGALYLAAKKKFQDAFNWIDRAITQTNNKYFSIRNSHAIILFDANINNPKDDDVVRRQIDNSMNILEKCFTDDKRKVFHAIRFGEQSIEYINRYSDEKAFEYIRKANQWLEDESKNRKWDIELSKLLRKITEIKHSFRL